ncbi:hydroxyquinol 1,2-dioxygenase [Cupriavidus sp. MP-37]|uniref:hydroxyquinol 1,2-dioxygenase n=1 Tax=Cupriavidus sp. MP-37 TaxID=2884455 RepID=UPI001D0BA5DB|nr:hydroxyquinol 1,2-dioxygenase [Cupriavidus sp. MP-37]UDM52787.1 hydroxyquinol 1,2-dioxygenase [Cupriavidus sp. MP-37]
MNPTFKTHFGSLAHYSKGNIEVTQGEARHYVFSNVFEVASKSAPYERVVVGKNLEYVVETVRAEGESPWFACAHDEFVIAMDGEVRVDFVALDQSLVQADGAVLAEPAGPTMGYVVLRQGHQSLLPAGCAYRFSTAEACTLLLQGKLGALSVQKWADICLH